MPLPRRFKIILPTVSLLDGLSSLAHANITDDQRHAAHAESNAREAAQFSMRSITILTLWPI